MGYFSNLAAELPTCDYDRSYPSPEEQLMWRLDDLQDRLEELRASELRYSKRTILNEHQLRYVLAEHLGTVWDVEAAIELAIDDLRCKYGIELISGPEELPEPVEELEYFERLCACA